MKPRVQAKFDQIRSYPFFENVGQSLPDSVEPVGSWLEAAKECARLKWSNSLLMARNAIQKRVEDQYPKPGMWERLQQWNPLAEETKPMIESLLASLMQKVPLPDGPKTEVRNDVQYYIFYTLLECELSDISEPVFFMQHLDPWYAAGRFPCGWTGREFPVSWNGVLPTGKLIVY